MSKTDDNHADRSLSDDDENITESVERHGNGGKGANDSGSAKCEQKLRCKPDDEVSSESIVELFDSLCVSYGDDDAILLYDIHQSTSHIHSGDTGAAAATEMNDAVSDREDNASSSDATPFDAESEEPTHAIGYLELQESSLTLAAQLWHRYRPDYVLVDCLGHPVAEAISLLACMRIQVPFVPVEVNAAAGTGAAGETRLQNMVKALVQQSHPSTLGDDTANSGLCPHVIAICCCDHDQDPMLGVLYRANIHRIVYVDPMGNLREAIHVPSWYLSTRRDPPPPVTSNPDELYVLFTSGTTTSHPKAVVGSHSSTFRRLQWWRDTFTASRRIARRTKLTFVDGITELLSALLHPPSVLVALTEPWLLLSHGLQVLLPLQPTQLTCLPSQLSQLLLLVRSTTPNDDNKNVLSSLVRIVCSGESFPASLWEQVQHYHKKINAKSPQLLEIINLYGQTESTGDVLCANLTNMNPSQVVSKSVIAVGKPILPDIRISTTAQGELVIQGNLAVRYLSQSDHFGALATGDVGFYNPDGIWYVQGRINEMDKVHGVWTSPAEVEAAVSQVFDVPLNEVAAAIVNRQVYLLSEQELPQFSRDRMRQAGMGWNVIPQQVFHRSIPRQLSGAGKVNRPVLRDVIQDFLTRQSDGDSVKSRYGNVVESTSPGFLSLVAKVLNRTRDQIDSSKSFVELGGDSASSVTLLYHLQQSGLISCNRSSAIFSATDILTATNLDELRTWVSGAIPRKRAKLSDDSEPKAAPSQVFHPSPPIQVSVRHAAVQFSACVDASPVLAYDGKSFYMGCQGGVLQCICIDTCAVRAMHYFAGWMIQADCLVTHDFAIVCLYQSHIPKGKVLAMSHDLQHQRWELEIDERVQASPLIAGTSNLAVIAGERRLLILDIATGKLRDEVELPVGCMAKPAVYSCDESSTTLVFAGNDGSLIKVLVYHDENSELSATLSVLHDYNLESAGLISKGLLFCPGNATIVASGAFGALLHCPIDTLTPTSSSTSRLTQLSPFPLSPAERIGKSDVVVGSYDGFLHFLSSACAIQASVQVPASVYCKPLVLPDGSCVVCTTAGYVIRIRNHCIVWQYRVAAEIWSDPVLVDATTGRIAFGARDSRVHILTIGGEL